MKRKNRVTFQSRISKGLYISETYEKLNVKLIDLHPFEIHEYVYPTVIGNKFKT